MTQLHNLSANLKYPSLFKGGGHLPYIYNNHIYLINGRLFGFFDI